MWRSGTANDSVRSPLSQFCCGTSRIRPVSSRTNPLLGNPASVLAAAFTPDGETLVTAAEDRAALLWDIRNLAQPTQAGHPLPELTSSVGAVAFTFDSQTMATVTTDKTLLLWNVSEPTQPRRLGTPLTLMQGRTLSAARFSPNGHLFATAGANETFSSGTLARSGQRRSREPREAG